MAADTPLSKAQKTYLARLAGEAFAQRLEFDLIRVPTGMTKSAFATQWRREQQAMVLGGGRQSLTEATQADYRSLKAHWLSLTGHSGKAFDAAMNSDKEHEITRQIVHLVNIECAKHGLTLGYAIAIARNRWHVSDLSHLTLMQGQQLLATLRRRGKSRVTTLSPKAARAAV